MPPVDETETVELAPYENAEPERELAAYEETVTAPATEATTDEPSDVSTPAPASVEAIAPDAATGAGAADPSEPAPAPVDLAPYDPYATSETPFVEPAPVEPQGTPGPMDYLRGLAALGDASAQAAVDAYDAAVSDADTSNVPQA